MEGPAHYLYPTSDQTVIGLWQVLVPWITHNPYLFLLDSFPIPVCRFSLVRRCHVIPLGQQPPAAMMMSRTVAYKSMSAFVPRYFLNCILAPGNPHELAGAEELLRVFFLV